MSFVESIKDIEINAFTLLDAIHDRTDDHDEAVRLIKAGRVFYPIEYRGFLAFVPSRFLGYKNNSIKEHDVKKSHLDGKETNREIDRYLGRHAENDHFEQKLATYVESIGGCLENRKHSFWPLRMSGKFLPRAISAVDDIDIPDVGNDSPEYKARMAGTYVRVAAVRAAVLHRANGVCEYCGSAGFLKPDKTPYLEAHHVIELSEQGEDKPHNVIALCANDHREAHFGAKWEAMQKDFLDILRKMDNK